MRRRKFIDTDAAPRPILLDPTLAKRKPVADVIYYEAPKSHATKFKLAFAQQQTTDTSFPQINDIAKQAATHKHGQKEPMADLMADDKVLSGLAEQLAAYSPLKPTKSWVLEKREKVDPTGIWGWQEKFLPISRRKFKCFGRLPLELRLLIWEHARPDPRIVQVAWSKKEPIKPKFWGEWEREIGSFLPEYRGPDYCANYSKAPIPSMLHACSESRTVALGWYQLALQPHLAESRIYFDFSADVLCPERFLYTNLRCDAECVNHKDRAKISKILYRCIGEHDPFFDLFLNYRGVKEILLFDASVGGLAPSDIQMHNLKESTKPFSWQRSNQKLYDMFLIYRKDYDALVDKYSPVIQVDGEIAKKHLDFDLDYPCKLPECYFRPEKITRVEIDFKPDLPEGSKVTADTASTAVGGGSNL